MDMRNMKKHSCLVFCTVLFLSLSSCKEEDPLEPGLTDQSFVPVLVSPPAGATTSIPCMMEWTSTKACDSYRIQICTSPEFEKPLIDQDVNRSLEFILDTGLPENRYYWRVSGTASDRTVWSESRAFNLVPRSDHMVCIPAGRFLMGNVSGHPAGEEDETPVHEVVITRPFLMGRTEVTQAQYEAVMGNNPSSFTGEDHPVEEISWGAAVAFCNALSILEGYDTCYTNGSEGTICDFTANGYRLPTEAEWEYACRGGTGTDVYTGNLTSNECDPLDPALDAAAWYCGNAKETTQPVASKMPNGYGLYDMHGNVWEWCWDRYDAHYYSESPLENPRGPATGKTRVFRGGSYRNLAQSCRSAIRSNFYGGYRYSYYGFRVVRSY